MAQKQISILTITDVRIMISKKIFTFAGAAALAASLGCMDISPPVRTESSDDKLLHSIHLPFEKAVYGVGDTDSIVVFGTLVTGDTTNIDPSKIKWRLSPATSALQIDTITGVIRAIQSNATTLTGEGLTLHASYTMGETTRTTYARIYITSNTYNIQKFQAKSLDSARGGGLGNSYILLSIFRGQILDVPQADLDVRDDNENVPLQFNPLDHVAYFLTDAETGMRFGSQKISFLNPPPPAYPPGLYIFGNAPAGDYWIGMEAYMYGKHFKDSIRFTQMSSAEIYFNVTNASGAPSVTASATVAQPCAVVLISNASSDTISIEMPPPDFECSGGIPAPSGRIVVPPGSVFTAVRARSLGYADGSTAEWKAFLGSSSQREIAKGSIRSKLGK